jgi:hypothetical protein
MTFTSTIDHIPELIQDDDELRKALVQAAELRIALADARTRQRKLGGGSVGGNAIDKAEFEDRKAAAAALVAGKKPPKPTAPALRSEFDRLRTEIPNLEAGIRTAIQSVREMIDRRADLVERATTELGEASGEVAAAADRLDAALARVAEAQYTIEWLRRFPKQAPAAPDLRIPSNGAPRGFIGRDELVGALKAHVEAAGR